MTSLTDVYDGGVGSVATRRRRVTGASLFLVGAAMVVGAIPIATTDLAAGLGLSVFEARKLAGVLAGLGLPAVFVGIFTVLPAGRATRGAAAIGASLAVLGVALFGYAYPYDWVASNPAMAVVTTLLYSVGTLVTFWCLFVGVATFKTRTDPGGSARLEITDEGTVRVVSDDTNIPGMGGIGLFGREPDGDVDTQTNQQDDGDDTLVPEPTVDETTPTGSQSRNTRSESGRPTPAGDGAGAVEAPETPTTQRPEQPPAAASADVRQAVAERGSPDRYCGNCSHFEYVRADGEITPYCGVHDELMEDMDACRQWDGNS
ncbi:MAG: hypothetical protein V5A45_00500 [Haloarculaceae archaeon]